MAVQGLHRWGDLAMTDNVVHVIPVNDLRPHDENGFLCPCNPSVEQVGNGYVVIHNSWDGREITEFAEDYVNDNQN